MPEHLKRELKLEKVAIQQMNASRIITWLQSQTVDNNDIVRGPSEVSLRMIDLQMSNQETPVKRSRVNLLVSKDHKLVL